MMTSPSLRYARSSLHGAVRYPIRWVLALLIMASASVLLPLSRLSAQQSGGFGSIVLGASLEHVSAELATSRLFLFDEADISTVPLSKNTLVSVRGVDYIEQGFLQFAGDMLVSIQLILNRQRVDHFSLYQTLVDKYGPPQSLTPQRSVWQVDTMRLSVDRPLIVTYIDQDYLRARQEQAAVAQQRESNLDAFLRQF